MSDLITALGLVLVLEGALYALFPGPMQRILQAALATPAGQLRLAGLTACGIGFVIVWLVRG